MRKEGDGLDSLTQPHLISQNGIKPSVMKCVDPVDSQELVFSQWELDQEGRSDYVVFMEPCILIFGFPVNVDDYWDLSRLGDLDIVQ